MAPIYLIFILKIVYILLGLWTVQIFHTSIHFFLPIVEMTKVKCVGLDFPRRVSFDLSDR